MALAKDVPLLKPHRPYFAQVISPQGIRLRSFCLEELEPLHGVPRSEDPPPRRTLQWPYA